MSWRSSKGYVAASAGPSNLNYCFNNYRFLKDAIGCVSEFKNYFSKHIHVCSISLGYNDFIV